MVNLLPLIQDYIPLFWIILIRVAGILAAMPAIGTRSVPLQVRIGLVVGLTVILFPIVSEQVPPGYHAAIQKYFDTLPEK